MSPVEIRSTIEFLYLEKANAKPTGDGFIDMWHQEILDFALSYWMKALKKSIKVKKISKNADMSAKIAAAKAYPLINLIENRQNMAKCPFHNDRLPSLNIKNNFYYCHGCGENGDTISFVMKTQNKTFMEAVAYLISI